MLLTERRKSARVFPTVSGWGWIGLGCMLVMMSLSVVAPLLLPVEWLATHRLVNGSEWGLAGVLAGFAIVELGIYGFHRACHRFQFMWRIFHQVHHSAQRVDIPGSVVFHPFELLAQNVLAIGITVFLLGLSPVTAAIVGYIVTFAAMFQHWNIKTPQWVGYIIQRPESHCLHHARDLHGYNYADLPLIDMVFGTFRNPKTFNGPVGFEQKPAYGKMLAGIDISRAVGTRFLAGTQVPDEPLPVPG